MREAGRKFTIREVNAAPTSVEQVEAVRATVGLCRDIVFAAALGVSKATIYRLTRRGLPTVQIGGKRWVNPGAAAAWLAANAQPGPGRPRKARSGRRRGADTGAARPRGAARSRDETAAAAE